MIAGRDSVLVAGVFFAIHDYQAQAG